jgi:hypothetical protein
MLMARPAPDDLMTSGDVARRLGISNQHVHTLATTGRLPVATQTPNGMRLFRRADIDRVADERQKSPPRRGPKRVRVIR